MRHRISMDRMGYSMNRSSPTAAVVGVVVCALLVLTGCSSTSESGHSVALQPRDVRQSLSSLKFVHKLVVVKPPRGDDAAFRGVAHGRHGATLHFSIGVGSSARTIPIPKTRLQDPVGDPGFVFNDDAAFGRKFKNIAQWRAAQDMAVEIEEALCKKATGRPCPV